MDLISIIVPVYKSEKYLSSCLDSILASTYSNLEIILVDDGSPDNCPHICDIYALKDSRIKVIHQKNMGVVTARNVGITIASGDYVGFVDSDDTIAPKMYELLLQTMQTTSCDVVACEYTTSQETLDLPDTCSLKPCILFTGIDAQLSVSTCAPSIRASTWAGPFVWNRLYKRKFITQLFRESYIIGEDLYFNWDYSKNSNSMAVIPVALYFYRQNEDSVSGQYQKYRGSVEKGISNVRVWMNLATDPTYTDSSLRRYIEARAAYMAHGELWRIYSSGEQSVYRDFVNTAQQLIRDHFIQVWKDKETYSLRIRGIIGVNRYLHPIWVAATKLHGLYRQWNER